MTLQEAKNILGVSEMGSPEILKKAFRKKVFECHPDRFIGAMEKIQAHRKFVLVQEAYFILKRVTQVSGFQKENPESGYQKQNEDYEEDPDLETILKGSFAGHVFTFCGVIQSFLEDRSQDPLLESVITVISLPFLMGFGWISTLTYLIINTLYEDIFGFKTEYGAVGLMKKNPLAIWVKPIAWASSILTFFLLIHFVFKAPEDNWPGYRYLIRYLLLSGVFLPAFIALFLEGTASYRMWVCRRRVVVVVDREE
jgi:hypothetical protein